MAALHSSSSSSPHATTSKRFFTFLSWLTVLFLFLCVLRLHNATPWKQRLMSSTTKSSSSIISTTRNFVTNDTTAAASGAGAPDEAPTDPSLSFYYFNESDIVRLPLKEEQDYDDDDHTSKLLHNVTTTTIIVTAYFRLPSKHDHSQYLEWIHNMMSFQDDMVIFTSPDLLPLLQAIRQDAIQNQTHQIHSTTTNTTTRRRRRPSTTMLIPMSLDHLPVAQLYPTSFWEDQLHRDPEQRLHQSYQLFWIWLSKSWFVTQAIQLHESQSPPPLPLVNVTSTMNSQETISNITTSSSFSRMYVWCDIGSVRDNLMNGQRMAQYADQVIPRHAMLFQAHTRPLVIPSHQRLFDYYYYYYYDDKSKLPNGAFYHSGSMAAGYADTWHTFHTAFCHTVQAYVDRHLWLGEDQLLLQSTCRRRRRSSTQQPLQNTTAADATTTANEDGDDLLCAYILPRQVPNCREKGPYQPSDTEDCQWFGLRYVLRFGLDDNDDENHRHGSINNTFAYWYPPPLPPPQSPAVLPATTSKKTSWWWWW